MHCAVDGTTDLKAKFARLRCKSLRRSSSELLTHALERETMEYGNLLPRKRGREEAVRKLVCFLCP